MDLYRYEGEPQPAFAPDVLVAYGVAQAATASYRFWRAGKPPDLVDGGGVGEHRSPGSGGQTAGLCPGRHPRILTVRLQTGRLAAATVAGLTTAGGIYVPIAGEPGPDGDRYYGAVLQT